MRFLVTSLLASLALIPALAGAQASAAKPIRLIVGFPPGGGIDFTARAIAPALEARLQQPVVVENSPGNGGVKAATDLARLPPDGQTLLLANTGPFSIAPHLVATPPYALKQFTFIGGISTSSYVAVARADDPADDLKALIARAKAKAKKLPYASAGQGSSTHLNGELLAMVAQIDMEPIFYKGSAPAVQSVIDGHAELLIDSGTVLLPHIKAGRLKALAVTGPRRDPQLPKVPTVRELGLPQLEATGFQGLVAPANLPKPVRDKLSNALREVLATPEMRARFADAGSEVQWRSPSDFSNHVQAESDKWSALIRKRQIKAE